MTTIRPTPEPCDCTIEDEYSTAVSDCCGAGVHDYVDGMCGMCKELTGWSCSICDAPMNDEVYG